MTETTDVGPTPAIDPELSGPLAAMNAIAPSELRRFSAANLTAIRDGYPGIAASPVDHFSRGGRFSVEETAAAGHGDAPDVPLLVCRPMAGDAQACIVYIHGGGMVLGNSSHGVDEILDYAERLCLTVVSVDYRLAPENPYPAPVEDCFNGVSWAAEHATELEVAANRLIVVGESAGGGLAAATVLLSRDRGGPAILGQLLIAPMLDHRSDSASMHLLRDAGMWDRASNIFGWASLLGTMSPAEVTPYASPATATDLSAMPPTFIDVGGADAFRDEAIDYATRISQAGGLVDLHVWAGAYHGFDGMAPAALVSRSARATREAWLARLMAHCRPIGSGS